MCLCELMGRVYRKLAECTAVSGASKAVLEAVSRADVLLDEHFLSPAAKYADTLAKVAMRGALSRVDPLFAQLWGDTGDLAEENERSARPAVDLHR